MRIISNKFIPFGNFGAINLLGLVFTRNKVSDISLRTKRHEGIHTYQQYELVMLSAIISLVLSNIYASWWYALGVVIIPFVIYVLSFLIEMVVPPYHNVQAFLDDKNLPFFSRVSKWCGNVWMDAYRDNCFEREAFSNDMDVNYLSTRPLCGWLWYIIPKKERTGK